jgi:hypothetical protein
MTVLQLTAIILAAATAACGGGAPSESGLRDSFAQQLSSNKFVTDFHRNGDELTFSGPGAEGGTAKWRVQIESAAIEPNKNDAQPYKGTVKSGWFSDGRRIEPKGNRSNLPVELQSNGISQDCWAFWEKASARWSWE